MFNMYSENMGAKTFLLECCQNIDRKQFKMLSIAFSEQALTIRCQHILFKCLMYAVYHTFNDECLKNISNITFIS